MACDTLLRKVACAPSNLVECCAGSVRSALEAHSPGDSVFVNLISRVLAVSLPHLLAEAASELALFAALGFLLFALDDLAVDLIYFICKSWRWLTFTRRFGRITAHSLSVLHPPGWLVVFIPAWD